MEKFPDQNIEAGGSEVNFHAVSEERKELRKALAELGGKGSKIAEKHYKKPLAEADEQAASLKDALDRYNEGQPDDKKLTAKEFLRHQKAEYEGKKRRRWR